jgi:crotonobetainyl-CoA:carnitine CoA-transferase CaiB-like acyl-CoA transferase
VSSSAEGLPLFGLRVLDLADASGAGCGRILADLGADVIKIEPPGGEAARCEPPFAGDVPDTDRSLSWFSANLNKRGITLDLATATGRELFHRLVATADIVVETPSPGEGLDYQALASINPRLILATFTPYGLDGPLSGVPGSDLEVTAASGCLWLAGESDRTPVRTSVAQTPGWTGMYGAAGVLMAVMARELTGQGQQVDVSAQAGMLTATSQAPIFWDLLKEEQHRSGPFLVGRSVTGAQFRNIWPCRDGYITFALYGGQAGRNTGRALVAWMNEAQPGGAPAVLKELDWDSLDVATAPQRVVDDIEGAIAPFFAGLSKAEFFTGVIRRNMLGYPLSTVDDVAADPQLASRGFWQAVDSVWDGEVCVPGSFALLDGQRLPVRSRAPRTGEHNVEVFCDELGLRRDELGVLRSAGIV